MNNGELINSYFRKGRGPGELISSKYTLNRDLLVIDDFQNDRVAFMHLDSTLSDPDYIPKLQKYNYESLTIMEDKNGKMLILNPYCFKDDVAKIDNNAPRFIVSEDNEKAPRNRYKYNTYNVVDGYVIANYEKDRVVLASMNAPPTIEIYDGDLNKLKELSGPENFEVKYHIEDYVLLPVLQYEAPIQAWHPLSLFVSLFLFLKRSILFPRNQCYLYR